MDLIIIFQERKKIIKVCCHPRINCS